ncbi:hypothetical protein EDB83DRAFT_315049 [Lactarius deliciosus]|nr:hypothetical protein EDB83DRAFT_315049 [Lactarius deliciosus]
MSASTVRSGFAYNEPTVRQPELLFASECWWRDRYNDIVEQGYRLRPRYHPQWEPSWLKTGKEFYTVEDGQCTVLRTAMDAIRIRDDRPVMLKKVIPGDGPHELRINQLFSSAEHSRAHDNHCAPLLDVIELSGHPGSQKLMVFPFLRPFRTPRFETFGEFSAFFTQICEGIRFMHWRNVAHRDCTVYNIMFDPSQMYPNGFHPVKITLNRNFEGPVKAYTRTQRPPRYYFIDFGRSRQYISRDATDKPLRGGDRSAPEYGSARHCNPFHTDIYLIGNMIRRGFMKKYNGFGFMEDLIASMTKDNPTERPLIEDVLQEFSRIRASLGGRKLRSPFVLKNAPEVLGIIPQARQTVRTLGAASSPDRAVETIPTAARNDIQDLAGYSIYNPSIASSEEASIASYKTERTINSRKSRYNAPPRRKYAHIERPQGLLSLDVEGPETGSGQHSKGLVPRLDGVPLEATVQNLISVDSEARAEVTSICKRLSAELKPRFATLVEHMYSFNTSLARASIIYNATRAQELLRDMNFIYPESRTSCDPYRHPIIQRAINTTWFRNEDDIGVVDREHFSPMPISVIAITLAVIEWCIDEWSDGTRRDSNWDVRSIVECA